MSLSSENKTAGGAQNQETTASKVYEKAIFESELSQSEKRDLATGYLDYLRETCSSVQTIRTVQSTLRESSILDVQAGKTAETILGGDDKIQSTILGKRKRVE